MPVITKSISQSERLAIFALWQLAKQHYAMARKCEREILARTGQQYQGSLSDGIFENDDPSGTEQAFDAALLKDGISVDDC